MKFSISSSFKHLLKANDQDEISQSQRAATEPVGKRAILKSLENCSLIRALPTQGSVQKSILRPLPSLSEANESTDLQTPAMFTQGLLRLFLDFPLVNQSKTSFSCMLLIICLHRADSSFENLHLHLASKAVLWTLIPPRPRPPSFRGG